MSLAKQVIVAVILIIPVVCIPNYLTFAIVEEKTETNATIYKVSLVCTVTSKVVPLLE